MRRNKIVARNILFIIQIIDRTRTWSIVFPGILLSYRSPMEPSDTPFSLISPDADGSISSTVKDIIRLPILILFVFVLLFILFFALSVLALWGSVYSEGREAALQVVEANIPGLLVQVLPAAVLVALLILLARIAAKPESRFLSLLIPLAGAFVLLAFGYQILQRFGPADEAGAGVSRAGAVEPSSRRYLVPGVFNTTESKVIYVEQIDERTVSPVVLAEGGSTDQKLLYFPQGLVLVGEDSVVLRMAGYTLEIDPDPVFGGLFTEDPVLRRLFADLDFLNGELKRVFRRSLPAFYFAVLALVVAFYGSGMFLRLSRWHLLNVALALLAIRGFLALFRFMSEGVVLELDKILENPQALQYLPEVTLLIVGGLLLLLDILFVPFRRREEE
jgi:hypothetical protein